MTADPEQAVAFAAAMKAAMSSADPEVQITGPDGRPIRIIKSPLPGAKARLEISGGQSGSLVAIVWEPTQKRPDAYPDGLPFIPDTAASTSTIMAHGRPGTQVQWFGVADLNAVVERLVAESLAEGWHRTRIQPSTPEPRRMITLERGSEGRTITAVATPGFGMVSVLDTAWSGSA
jgi:hypothetical protein